MRLIKTAPVDQKWIDLVPVLNVVLLLTFFFLLSWSFVLQPGIEIRLPSSELASANPQGRHVITLKFVEGTLLIFLDEKKVDEGTLTQNLNAFSASENGEWLTLNADDAVPHGQVQHLATLAIEKGFRVNVATQRASPLPAGP
jgi:biopolymer transport protein ExbD